MLAANSSFRSTAMPDNWVGDEKPILDEKVQEFIRDSRLLLDSRQDPTWTG